MYFQAINGSWEELKQMNIKGVEHNIDEVIFLIEKSHKEQKRT